MIRYIYVNRSTVYPFFDDVNNGKPFNFIKYFAAVRDVKNFVVNNDMYYCKYMLDFESEKWGSAYGSLTTKVNREEYKVITNYKVPTGRIHRGVNDVFGQALHEGKYKLVKVNSLDEVQMSLGKTAWCSGEPKVCKDILTYFNYYFVRTDMSFKSGYGKLAILVNKQTNQTIIQNSFSQSVNDIYCDCDGNIITPFEYTTLESLNIKI